jgi:hypothetical protein
MTRIAVGVVLVLVASALGCGGATFGGASDAGAGEGGGSSSGSGSGGSTSGGSGSGGSTSGSSGSGSSSGGSSGSPCPATPPAQGAPCSAACNQAPPAAPCLTCEWGTSPDQTCNEAATCSGGAWQRRGHTPGDCQPPSPPASCPPSFASVPRRAHCSPYGAICDYPQGLCACNVAFGPAPVDASAEATWSCQDPGPGCPTPRPLLGSACSQEGLQCDYGACVIPGGGTEACSGGIWVDVPALCPMAAGGAP